MQGRRVTNIVVAGLGGQGVLTATDIIAGAAFLAGYDVKKSEIHGMSQRGGSVTSDVRFGPEVWSPMVPEGEADYLVVLEPREEEMNLGRLRAGGVLITPQWVEASRLQSRKSMNVALVGALSAGLDIELHHWQQALKSVLPEELQSMNLVAFELGREAGKRFFGTRG